MPTATTRVAQPAAYIQDVISLNDDKLKVTAGLRVDVPIYGNTALENTAVTAMTFKDENGADVQYNTSKLPDTKPLWSPRIGFNWDVKGDRSLQVRGGTGIFSGRPAFVWISNQVGNNGILSGSSRIDNTKDYPFNTDVTAYIPANPTTPSSFNIAVTDNDFRFPQLFRTNLAVDKKLPFGIVGTIEGIYNRQINNVKYINANLEPSTTTFAGPDNRAIYPGIGLSGTAQNNALRINDNITDATVLKNTKEGYSYTLTGKLERQFQKGLYIMAAYNFGQAQDLMTAGSIAFSSWRDLTSVNGNNNATISYSDFDQRHRIIGALSYKFDYSKVTNTSVSLFFQSGTQGRYSFIVNGDMNGDQLTANDLIYVPKDGSEIRFADIKDANGNVTQSAAEQNAAFMTFVDNNEYLSSRKGSYAERNGALMPWLTTLDLTIMQDIYVYKTHKLTLRADIFNFGNIISNAWGVGDRVINNVPLKYVTKDADNYPEYNFNKVSGSYPTEALQKSNTLSDVWQAQLGVRYTF